MRHLWFSFCLLIIASCSAPLIYDETVAIHNGSWSYSEPASFSFDIDDVSSKHNLYLDIDHSTDFPYENLYVRIHTAFPDQTDVSDTLSIQMIDNQGNWIGECSGTTCDLKVFLQEQIKFKAAGKYTIQIEQFTRSEQLEGVNSISFSIE